MEVAFKDLKPGDYEIHVGIAHYYIGTFKQHVDNLAYFDPVKAVFPKGMVHYSQGQYFQEHRIFKKIETQDSSKE
jgi:hypothetical protein